MTKVYRDTAEDAVAYLLDNSTYKRRDIGNLLPDPYVKLTWMAMHRNGRKIIIYLPGHEIFPAGTFEEGNWNG